MGRSRYKVLDQHEIHFITSTVVEWIPLFEDNDIVKILIDSLSFLQTEKRIKLYAYVIMYDHVHLIASAGNLTKEIGDFKSYTARETVDLLRKRERDDFLSKLHSAKLQHKKLSKYQIWQEGCHPEIIRSKSMMRQKIDYIHYNPVRKGYMTNELEWKYSSASNYETGKGILDVITDW